MTDVASLVLRMAGPMQSWGVESRFTRRTTGSEPSKSGVIGLLAAAQGRRRTDPIEDLVRLRFGVRVEQPGQLVRDYQTAQRITGAKVETMPLSQRYYLGDAVFLAFVEGPREVVETLRQAILRPKFPLYLGRRSCPPAGPLAVDVADGGLESALKSQPWRASSRHQRMCKQQTTRLSFARDAQPGEATVHMERDEPESFDPQRRTYRMRPVVRGSVPIHNPHGVIADDHDPMSAL